MDDREDWFWIETWRASQGEITPGNLQNLLRDKKDNPDFLQADKLYQWIVPSYMAKFSFTKESHSSRTANKTPEFLKSMQCWQCWLVIIVQVKTRLW